MTWSVVAVDPHTREVGVGAASCAIGVELIRGIVPGKGVVAAQAWGNLYARDQAVKAITRGATADEVLAAAEAHSGRNGQSAWKDQQFGVAVLEPEPRAIAHTGDATLAWAGSRATSAVSVQGNILRGREVVDVAMAAFQSDEGTPDLAERIMRALEAGNEAGGDNRCPFECPALAAFIAVAGPDESPHDDPSLYLAAPKFFGIEGVVRHATQGYARDPADPPPVAALRAQFDVVRSD
ncbi:MAG: DUF1028 domain-containing protein [Myxococcota bacterium]|nr:DUF1028 domain-containing protein [Myxococcota bacterium]